MNNNLMILAAGMSSRMKQAAEANKKSKVSEQAFKVHGYSDEFLSDKKKFAEIADDFIEFIGDKN